MRIDVFFCGKYDYSFDSSNEEEIGKMAYSLNNHCDTVMYCTEDGDYILHWPMEVEEEYQCMGRDYGPGNPWDAPGMCVSDFIR